MYKRVLLVLLAAAIAVSCGGKSDSSQIKLSSKLQAVLQRSEVQEQDWRQVPSGLKGYLLYLSPADLKMLTPQEAAQILVAAAAKQDLGDAKGVRVRLVCRATRGPDGWLFGEVVWTKGQKPELNLTHFNDNRVHALLELHFRDRPAGVRDLVSWLIWSTKPDHCRDLPQGWRCVLIMGPQSPKRRAHLTPALAKEIVQVVATCWHDGSKGVKVLFEDPVREEVIASISQPAKAEQ